MKKSVIIAALAAIMASASCSQSEMTAPPESGVNVFQVSKSGVQNREAPAFPEPEIVSLEEADIILAKATVYGGIVTDLRNIPYTDEELAALPAERRRKIELERLCSPYMVLDGYTLIFNMEEEEAAGLGISKSEFLAFASDIKQRNENAKRIIASGGTMFIINPQTSEEYEFYIADDFSANPGGMAYWAV